MDSENTPAESKVKILVGFRTEVFGTISLGPNGLEYEGDVRVLEGIAQSIKQSYGWTDSELIENLPKVRTGQSWAIPAP